VNRVEAKYRIKQHLKLATSSRKLALKTVKQADPDMATYNRDDRRRRGNFLTRLERARESLLETRAKGTRHQIGRAERRYYDLIRNAYKKLIAAIDATPTVHYWDGHVDMGNIAQDIIGAIECYKEEPKKKKHRKGFGK